MYCHFHQEYQRRCNKSAIGQKRGVQQAFMQTPAKKPPKTGQKINPVDNRRTQTYNSGSKEILIIIKPTEDSVV